MLAFGQVLLAILFFFLNCFAERVSKTSRKTCPETNASFLQKLLFSWSLPLLWKGFRTTLSPGDLWELPEELTSQTIVSNFENKKLSAKSNGTKDEDPAPEAKAIMSVLPVLVKVFCWDLVLISCLEMVTVLCWQALPMVMKLLITFAKNQAEEPAWHGQLYAVVLFCLATTGVLVMSQNLKHQFSLGMKLRTALTSALYKKSLCLSTDSRKESTVGEVVNLMSADVDSVVLLGQHVIILWSCPLQIVIATVGMYEVLGWPALVGVASLLLGAPVTLLLAKLITDLMARQMKTKDKRLRILSEIISGIKVLKLYAWEVPFANQVLETRAEETRVMRRKATYGALVSFMWRMIPFMVGFVAFACYYTTGEELAAEQAFVTLAYLNLMMFPMTMLGILIPWVMMTKVSLVRIDKFLNLGELQEGPSEADEKAGEDAISVTDGSFQWGAEGPPVLQELQLSVRAGSLTAVVGRVGAGKSSLLSALLGDMHQSAGRASLRGSRAYVPQLAWVQNCSLKENILFCRPEDPARYQSVLESCALRPDLAALPAGDRTELGERGITLSGGQKQRVSLARAVYSAADTFLFDDPLAAVDAHVGKHIFDRVLGPDGVLREKTRVLVTHSLAFLPQCDHIIVMAEGRVKEQGTYQQLVGREAGELAKVLAEYAAEQDRTKDQAEEKGPQQQPHQSAPEAKKPSRSAAANEEQPDVTEPLLSEQDTRAEEAMATGRVKLSVYLTYLRALGPRGCAASLLALLATMALTAGTDWWVKVWTDSSLSSGDSSDYLVNLGVYGTLGLLQATAFCAYSVSIVFTTLRGSKLMHRDMLHRVIRSPMAFFETTPLGRIINRFGKDIDTCDTILPDVIKMLLVRLSKVITLMAVIMVILPSVILVVVPVVVVFLLLQQGIVRTIRQLQRLASVSRSPIYSHFSETLNGAATIRAFRREQDFIARSEELVDASQRCNYPNMVSDRLLFVTLTFLGNLVTLSAALLVPGAAVSPGSVGLALTCSLQLPPVLAELMRFIAQLETNIVAVERIGEYLETGQEAAWDSGPGSAPEPGWPEHGRVEVEGLGLRYGTEGPPALQGVTCSLAAGERVGVVGRTGAGKSSLAAALFRLVEAETGAVRIDGRDIASLGLHALRSRLTIIPQDPVLFAGSLRMNLDPFSQHPNSAVQEALAKAHLGPWAAGLEEGLEHAVAEGGGSLSMGQRQLVCLARALLRRSRVLVLDEATASMDIETDALIQATVRREFPESTVITIAHRLHTVLDCHRILVMDHGRLVECDAPGALLADTDSLFHAMARDAGILA
jgi:ABC-type multidrug transport system fused ATPase/permease subunit